MKQDEIDKTLARICSNIDYEPGDWVETCNLLPGIVQKIIVRYNEERNYIEDTVKIFYPHYAFTENIKGQYSGGSNCSVENCGVHKISAAYAIKLMSLGEEELKKLWNKMCEDYQDKTEIPCWEDYVDKRYKELFGEPLLHQS